MPTEPTDNRNAWELADAIMSISYRASLQAELSDHRAARIMERDRADAAEAQAASLRKDFDAYLARARADLAALRAKLEEWERWGVQVGSCEHGRMMCPACRIEERAALRSENAKARELLRRAREYANGDDHEAGWIEDAMAFLDPPEGKPAGTVLYEESGKVTSDDWTRLSRRHEGKPEPAPAEHCCGVAGLRAELGEPCPGCEIVRAYDRIVARHEENEGA